MKSTSLNILLSGVRIIPVMLALNMFSLVQAQNHSSEKSELAEFVSNEYGVDHELVNGVQYYNKYYHVQNHPFFMTEEFSTGNLEVSGNKYEDVRLNYDIHSQQVILEYKSSAGASNKVLICSELIDRFDLESFHFERLNLNGQYGFYQLIEDGNITMYINWSKKIQVKSSNLSYSEYFTAPQRKYYLRYADEIYAFSGKRSFSSIFPKENRKEIRKYLRKNNIRFKSVSPGELAGLLQHVAALIS